MEMFQTEPFDIWKFDRGWMEETLVSSKNDSNSNQFNNPKCPRLDYVGFVFFETKPKIKLSAYEYCNRLINNGNPFF